jgi:hypothetical protein
VPALTSRSFIVHVCSFSLSCIGIYLASSSRPPWHRCPVQVRLGLCHTCQLGHHIHLPFINSSSRADNIFDLIHCDLWTSPVVSVSDYKYYLVILDNHSHFVWIFPLCVKFDTFFTLSIFSLMFPHSLTAPSNPSSATMVMSSMTHPLTHSSSPKGFFCRCLVPILHCRTVKPSASFAPLTICCAPYFFRLLF